MFLPDRLMVGHRPLEASILVRIQVRQLSLRSVSKSRGGSKGRNNINNMAKAQIKLTDGPEVQIEGTPAEIKELLSFYSQAQELKRKPSQTRANGNAQAKSAKKDGPAGLIRELIEEGYFSGQKRTLPDVQKKLEEGGHIYAQTSLSTPMTRLTRNKELRRIKEKKGWAYVV